ncbi:MAG: acyltransferase family protein [Thiohalocapsa sp.]
MNNESGRSPALSYRADVDGLRALAVIPVVFFHLGIPGFSGGYVGVDVFFVISGYLITKIILSQLQRGSFSLFNFYRRRMLRIFPALFFTLAISSIAAFFLMSPADYQRFARSLVAATTFTSTFFFNANSDYFAGDAINQPLLHTWSLSVEEIFYIVFPFLLILIWKVAGRAAWWFLLLAFIASLVASATTLLMHPESEAPFFLPQFRAWELLGGALLATSATHLRLGASTRGWLGVLGLTALAIAVMAYNEQTPFPGLAALVPCGAAALVIISGADGSSPSSRLLSMPVLVFFGLISYSLYLLHWPALSFFSYLTGREPLGWEVPCFILAITVVAWASWALIEQRLRHPKSAASNSRILGSFGAAAIIFIAVGLHGHSTDGWAGRGGEAAGIMVQGRSDRDPRQAECLLDRSAGAQGCKYGNKSAEATVALWGDSHAAVFAAALGQEALDRNDALMVFTMPSCPPVLGWQPPGLAWRDACDRFQKRAFEAITAADALHTVILGARFAKLPHGRQGKLAESALAQTLSQLRERGKRVLIVYPVPEQAKPVPMRVENVFDAGVDGGASQRFSRFKRTQGRVFEVLDSFVDRDDAVAIYPHRSLCDDTHCYAYLGDKALFFDRQHLSLAGAQLVMPQFEGVFD